MQKKVVSIMAVICAVLIIWSFSSCQQVRKMEVDFSKKKAALIKDNLDLKDKLDSLQKEITQKTTQLAQFEESSKSLKEELMRFKLDNESLRSEYNKLNSNYADLMKKDEALKGELRDLKEKYSGLSIPVQAGKSVSLTPIVVSGKKGEGQSAISEENKEGQVVSIDKNNSLVVIDLGRKNKIKEGDVCEFFKNTEKIASGQIFSVRYDMAAVFLNEAQYKSAFNEIKVGDKVLVGEQG